MVVLEMLEQKFMVLAELVKELRAHNSELQSESILLKQEIAEVKADNEKLTFECLQLASKLDAYGIEHDEVHALHQERERTKAAVENLIKDIELLVVKEQQL